MELQLPNNLIERMIEAGCKNPIILEVDKDDYDWGNTNLDSKYIEEEDCVLLEKLLGKKPDTIEERRLIKKIAAIREVRVSTDKTYVNLEKLSESMIAVIKKLSNKRLYEEDENGNYIAFYVEGVRFHPTYREEPQHIIINLLNMNRFEKKTTTRSIYRQHLASGKTAYQVLTEHLGFLFETKELNDVYDEEIVKYFDYEKRLGEQFLAIGKTQARDDDDRRWSTIDVNLGTVEQPSKVIVDDTFGSEDKVSNMISNSFWTIDFKKEKDGGTVVHLPTNPLIQVFDLRLHLFMDVHINQLNLYKYDSGLSSKLILPIDTSTMIETLVEAVDITGDDIIKGKSGGIIILSSGEPGTGKTLTAEVFSEHCKKPLYVVQCSQLGVDPEELETKLATVLTRASRWGVILLIDEADVYIHERGSDVGQNAIVGVFLRLLEYYPGILFLTTNRATIVDDAIVSRLTAHVRYGIPKVNAARKIWEIQFENYDLELDGKLIEALLAKFPNISGRTIKQLTRLAKIFSVSNKKEISIKLFEKIALFTDLESN